MSTNKSPIEHIVVLTLENRSFDHMLGLLPRGGHLKTLEGLSGSESNYLIPGDQSSTKISIKEGAIDEFHGNTTANGCSGPGHGFSDAVYQLTGKPSRGGSFGTVTNDGFVASFAQDLHIGVDPTRLQLVMESFTPSQLPALSTLAQEFVVCDHWFSSVPGPTMPNRLYMHAATSAGYDYNDWRHHFDFDSIYNRLDGAKKKKSWSIYSSNFDIANNFTKLRQHKADSRRFPHTECFYADVASGKLQDYSFIVPNFIDGHDATSYTATNSQHAPTSVAHGEKLIADVYNAIRSNDKMWKKTLLVIVYDEHGGFYDHVAPPGDVANPDGKTAGNFDFKQLGVRVPAVLVSPWLEKKVDHTVYEHASIPATLNRFWGLGDYLTERDKAANSFEGLLTGGTFRTDTPTKLKYPEHADSDHSHQGSRPLDPIQKDIALGTIAHEPDEAKRGLMEQLVEAGATQREISAMIYEIRHKVMSGPE